MMATTTQFIAASKSVIYHKLRHSIIMGHRESGERLNVEKIAQENNTSITPVRDHDREAARQALLDDIDQAHEAILDSAMEEDAKSWQI